MSNAPVIHEVSAKLAPELALASMGITRENLKEIGVDFDKFKEQAFSGRYVDQFLVETLFPEYLGTTSPTIQMKLAHARDVIRNWGRREFVYLAKAGLTERRNAADAIARYNKMGEENNRLREQLVSAQSETRAATDRRGLYATQDKTDLDAALARIEDLKRSNQYLTENLQSERDSVDALKNQVAKLERILDRGQSLGQAALERFLDRFDHPTPLVAEIIEQLKGAFSALKPGP